VEKCGHGHKGSQQPSVTTGRRLEHSTQFTKNLQSFAQRKDPELPKQVQQALKSRLEQGPAGNDRCLSGFQSLPLFKMRVQAQERGKRSGARVVYYCDHKLLFSLWTYLKSQQENMSEGDFTQITDILQAADLWGPSPLG